MYLQTCTRLILHSKVWMKCSLKCTSLILASLNGPVIGQLQYNHSVVGTSKNECLIKKIHCNYYKICLSLEITFFPVKHGHNPVAMYTLFSSTTPSQCTNIHLLFIPVQSGNCSLLSPPFVLISWFQKQYFIF